MIRDGFDKSKVNIVFLLPCTSMSCNWLSQAKSGTALQTNSSVINSVVK